MDFFCKQKQPKIFWNLWQYEIYWLTIYKYNIFYPNKLIPISPLLFSFVLMQQLTKLVLFLHISIPYCFCSVITTHLSFLPGQMINMFYPERRIGDPQSAALFQFLWQNTRIATERCCTHLIPIRMHTDPGPTHCFKFCSEIIQWNLDFIE